MTWLARAAGRLKGGADRSPEGPGTDPLAAASPDDRRIVERAMPYSMIGEARLLSVVDAVRYLERRRVPGAFAECGVWRGGSVLAMILTLDELGVHDRDLYLFDTFSGMTEPGPHDTSEHEPPATETWRGADEQGRRAWPEVFGADVYDEESVRGVLLDTGYPPERIHIVKGPVERTLPGAAPTDLALLRLDTDWYESTWHELDQLYPRLGDGGVLVIDDYGHWEGARRAVDEYFATRAEPLLLSRIDYTGRIAVKH